MGRIEEFLHKREESNLLRVLHPATYKGEGFIYFNGKKYLDFSSNDYLGLSQHPRLKKAAKRVIEEFGIGCSASRLLSGDFDLHHCLEEEIAKFKGKEAGLVFNSGYQANVGIISSLCKRGDVIFSDKLNHASIIDGIIMSGAKFFRFRHNDLNHLHTLLKKERGKFKTSLIVTETIFSMEGDKPPLRELVRLKEKYDCLIMVDEAHATGIFGEKGSGVVEEENLTEKIDIIMGTFSKALGSFGAYVVSSEKVKQYFINKCRSFIYSTALPLPIIAANLESINIVKEESQRRKYLLENCRYLRRRLQEKGFNVRGCSQIVPWIIGEEKQAIYLSNLLQKEGVRAFPIRFPTVPKGEARIRFSVTYYHTRDILDNLINVLSKTDQISLH